MKWPQVTVEAIRASSRHSLVGGPFGSDLTTRDYVEEGVPVIRGVNLPDAGSFSDEDFVFVSEQKADALSANNAFPGDVIFTQRGTLGQVGLIPLQPNFPRYVVSQSQMKLAVDPDKADARFVFYFFRHPATVQSIKNRAITSGVPHINLGILRDFKLPLPPLVTQRKIVATLTTYDDLMENNRRRMALLEESTRLLYREWFVRLRWGGHEKARSKNGLPTGWAQKKLGDVLTLKRGYDLPSASRTDGEIPIISSSGITGFHSEKKADAPGVVTGRYGTLGEVYFINQDYWPLNTALFVSDFKGHSAFFILHLLKHELQSIQSDKAAIPGLNRNVVHERSILYPPESLRDQFTAFVEPIYRQLGLLHSTNQKLRTARDHLLPRLMSGELAV